MRQGQQNRRGRGRGGRKGQNPLSRSFESSGPDIKIRGTAQHIAEKYMALARDAIGSGDLVLGENYLQHAEHYNRIIMAAQPPVQGGFDQQNGNGQRIARPEGDLTDGDGFEGDDDEGGDQQPQVGQGFEPPRFFDHGQPREHQNNNQHQPRFRDNRDRDNRHYDNRNNNNYENRNHQPRSFDQRGGDGNRGYVPRGEGYRNDGPRHNDMPRNNDGPRSPEHRGEPPRNFEPRGNENRGSFEPRFQEPPRQPVSAPAEQPREFDVEPVPQPDAAPVQAFEPRPQGEGAGPRPRRRRPRHENGAARAYPPQVGETRDGGEPQALPPDHLASADGNGNGSDGQG